MEKITVAIGGGETGRTDRKGSKYPYETFEIDKEIVGLTKKKNPNLLFLAHSIPISGQISYFKTIEKIWNEKFGCICKNLTSEDLQNLEYSESLVEWADIVYHGGGSTQLMINLWNETGFDKILYEAWNKGKVLCGLSAGANAWFKLCNSDSLKVEDGFETPWTTINCLSFIPLMLTPHCEEAGRFESTKKQLLENNEIGLSLSNCAAIEIVDDKYKIIIEDAKFHKIEAYAKKTYWLNGEYKEETLNNYDEYKSLKKLCEKEKLFLEIPTLEREKQAKDYIQEFLINNSNINGAGNLNRNINDYEKWINDLENKSKGIRNDGFNCAETTYFSIRKSDGKIIGMVNIRHELNDFLLDHGGNIGYSVRPTERKKGYASIILKLAVQKCLSLGIENVLLIADKKNIPSIKTIEKNFGVLENEIKIDDKIKKRYWINCKSLLEKFDV